MLLLIDNYDSFTYNLVQEIGSLDPSIDLRIVRNDKITVDEADALRPTHLILSPGPCTPKESGICGDLIQHFRGRIPILGVCLGHQTIADRHGMTVRPHNILMHGKTSEIHHDGKGIFRGLPNPFTATRYHSLIVDRATLSPDFEISAWTESGGAGESGGGEIMALRWKGFSQVNKSTGQHINTSADSDHAPPMDGVQFHPESFLTTAGPQLLANFLGIAQPLAASRDRGE